MFVVYFGVIDYIWFYYKIFGIYELNKIELVWLIFYCRGDWESYKGGGYKGNKRSLVWSVVREFGERLFGCWG